MWHERKRRRISRRAIFSFGGEAASFEKTTPHYTTLHYTTLHYTTTDMTKKKYKINPETLAMEQVEQGLRYWLRQTGIYILGGIVLGIVFLFLFLYFFPSPREKQLLKEKDAAKRTAGRVWCSCTCTTWPICWQV